MEVWKDINGYEGLYQVSNCGKVKSLNRIVKSRWGTDKVLSGKPISEIVDSLGYSRVSLSKEGKVKAFKIHRLVAESFIDGTGHINHIDGNKQNNKVENLEFCTSEYNLRHAVEIGLKPSKYKQKIVCEETGYIYESKSHLAREIGVSAVFVSSYMNGNFNKLKNKTYKYI